MFGLDEIACRRRGIAVNRLLVLTGEQLPKEVRVAQQTLSCKLFAGIFRRDLYRHDDAPYSQHCDSETHTESQPVEKQERPTGCCRSILKKQFRPEIGQ